MPRNGFRNVSGSSGLGLRLTFAKDIFDEPHFSIDGMTASDVRQGRDGDCWFMSSVCTLSNKEDLLEKVCVARDEKVGVYGFVFHRGRFGTQTTGACHY